MAPESLGHLAGAQIGVLGPESQDGVELRMRQCKSRPGASEQVVAPVLIECSVVVLSGGEGGG